MPSRPRYPTIRDIIVSTRFWLLFLCFIAGRIIIEVYDGRRLKLPIIVVYGLAMALFGVWMWDRIMTKRG